MKTRFSPKVLCVTLLAISVGTSFVVFGQAPTWKWTKTSSTDSTTCTAVKCDKNGNSFVVGVFTSAAPKFGNITLNQTGFGDCFIVKYDSVGNVLWAKSGIGDKADVIEAVAIDGNGNVFVCGSSDSNSLKFGGVTLQKSSGIAIQLFIIKFDKNGNALWGKNVYGMDSDEATQIALDDLGNVWMAGQIRSTSLNFGSGGTVNNVGDNFFLAKYNSSGTFQWVKSSNGPSFDAVTDLAADGKGNVYVTGTFSQNTFKLGSNSFTPKDVDSFFAKYTSSGTLSWARQIGNTGDDFANAVVADINDNVWIGGWFNGSQEKLVFGNDTLKNIGLSELFIAKYTTSGNPIWARSANSAGSEQVERIATDGFGYVWIAGVFYISGDSLKFGNSKLTCATQGPHAFIAKYDPNGNDLWGLQSKIYGDAVQHLTGLGVDNKGLAIIVGDVTNGNCSFGSTFVNTTQGNFKMFVARSGADQLSDIEQISSESRIRVYPNPSTGILYIESPAKVYSSFYDAEGRIIKQSEQPEIDLSNYPKGMYFYTIQAKETIKTGKIILE